MRKKIWTISISIILIYNLSLYLQNLIPHKLTSKYTRVAKTYIKLSREQYEEYLLVLHSLLSIDILCLCLWSQPSTGLLCGYQWHQEWWYVYFLILLYLFLLVWFNLLDQLNYDTKVSRVQSHVWKHWYIHI